MKAKSLRALLLGLMAVTLAGCAPGTAVGRIQQEVQSRLPQSLTGGASGPADSGPAADIKLVIQRGNFEQEQAIKARDSSIMKDTSTDSYYQQLVQNNQDMLDSGVTAIKLTKIEWGAISVNGSSAKATTYETWSTDYSDGSTDQSRDQNNYGLLQQNGAWKINADDQPNSGQPSASAQPAARTGQPSPSASAQPSGRGRTSPSASPSPATSTSSPLAISAQPGTPEAAIQQVILKGNQEQEQAIASKNSAVMKDTSTDSYYQDLSQANQDMLDSGVTAIKLAKIEWGQITVNGNNATATTFETWSTTYSDGSTDQSRERNVYTLVQQNGAWKVQADDHPDSGFIPGTGTGTQPSGQTPGPSPQDSPAPGPVRGRGVSSNWSGYAASGGQFTSVSGTWTVPSPSSGGQLGADAAWVGIGGERSRDLIQAGTEETVLSSGRVQYDAWIETLPQYSHPIPMPVHPGDSVTVSITQQQPGTWAVDFKNNTTGEKYDRTLQYQSSLSSAEWVEEAPSGGRGGVLPLDSFGSVTFSNATTIKDGKSVNLSQANASPITMINRSDQPIATTSAISPDGTSFTVTRTSNSASTPGNSGSFTRRPRGSFGG